MFHIILFMIYFKNIIFIEIHKRGIIRLGETYEEDNSVNDSFWYCIWS